MKGNRIVVHFAAKIGIAVTLCLVILFLFYANYRNSQSKGIVLKSRYTFHVRIDEQGNVVNAVSDSENEENYKEFPTISPDKIGDVWIRAFTHQFTQRYVPTSKALCKVKYEDTQVLDPDTNTVLIRFSAVIRNRASDYFQSWRGVVDNNRTSFEWVVTFTLDNHYDKTATVYVENIVSPEDYGIAQYNAGLVNTATTQKNTNTKAQKQSLVHYEIRNNVLSVTYDGGEKYITVPVDCANLPIQAGTSNLLMDGSYKVATDKTAFLYGGKTVDNVKIPVTVTYSNDRGNSWITSEIETLSDVDYYYVEFFDENRGVVVLGYGKNENQQSSRMYTTQDGGTTWTQAGSGPATNVLKGVVYIEEEVGFFVYNYVEGMDSNIYMTRDGGKTFSKIMLEEQELDTTAANSQNQTKTADAADTTGKLSWRDVYKEAMVPVYDSDGNITIYLTQGSDGVYNNGKTVAKYQSVDGGLTWKYIGQLELTEN